MAFSWRTNSLFEFKLKFIVICFIIFRWSSLLGEPESSWGVLLCDWSLCHLPCPLPPGSHGGHSGAGCQQVQRQDRQVWDQRQHRWAGPVLWAPAAGPVWPQGGSGARGPGILLPLLPPCPLAPAPSSPLHSCGQSQPLRSPPPSSIILPLDANTLNIDSQG